MKEYLLRLLDYEHWANRAVIESLEEVGNPPMRAVQLMGHILSSQQVWLARVLGETSYVAIWEDIPISWMTQTAGRNYERIKSFLEMQSDEVLLRPITYVNSRGQDFTHPLGDVFVHMSHHAAYHRGQVVQLIRPQLDEPPATDYILWARQ